MENNSFYQLIGDYSIHTIDLYHHLIYEDYKNIFDILKGYSQYHEIDELPEFLNTYETHSYPSVATIPGLRFRLSNSDTGLFGVNLEINPVTLFMYDKGVFDHFDNLQISPTSYLFWKEFIVAFGNALDSLGLGYLTDWIVSRIDLSVNIAIDKSFDLQKYIYYLKKTIRRYGRKLDGFKDENIDPYSFKIFSKNIALVVYDKMHQLETDGELNVMRVELQLRGKRIKREIDEYDPFLYYDYGGLPPLLDRLIILSQNSKDIMLRNIQKMLPSGDYYNESMIEYILTEKGHVGNKIKTDLWKLLHELTSVDIDAITANRINLNKTQKSVKKKYLSEHSSMTYYSRMALLKRLGIAPIYIPNNDGTVYMPGLYTILHDLAE